MNNVHTLYGTAAEKTSAQAPIFAMRTERTRGKAGSSEALTVKTNIHTAQYVQRPLLI